MPIIKPGGPDNVDPNVSSKNPSANPKKGDLSGHDFVPVDTDKLPKCLLSSTTTMDERKPEALSGRISPESSTENVQENIQRIASFISGKIESEHEADIIQLASSITTEELEAYPEGYLPLAQNLAALIKHLVGAESTHEKNEKRQECVDTLRYILRQDIPPDAHVEMIKTIKGLLADDKVPAEDKSALTRSLCGFASKVSDDDALIELCGAFIVAIASSADVKAKGLVAVSFSDVILRPKAPKEAIMKKAAYIMRSDVPEEIQLSFVRGLASASTELLDRKFMTKGICVSMVQILSKALQLQGLSGEDKKLFTSVFAVVLDNTRRLAPSAAHKEAISKAFVAILRSPNVPQENKRSLVNKHVQKVIGWKKISQKEAFGMLEAAIVVAEDPKDFVKELVKFLGNNKTRDRNAYTDAVRSAVAALQVKECSKTHTQALVKTFVDIVPKMALTTEVYSVLARGFVTVFQQTSIDKKEFELLETPLFNMSKQSDLYDKVYPPLLQALALASEKGLMPDEFAKRFDDISAKAIETVKEENRAPLLQELCRTYNSLLQTPAWAKTKLSVAKKVRTIVGWTLPLGESERVAILKMFKDLLTEKTVGKKLRDEYLTKLFPLLSPQEQGDEYKTAFDEIVASLLKAQGVAPEYKKVPLPPQPPPQREAPQGRPPPAFLAAIRKSGGKARAGGEKTKKTQSARPKSTPGGGGMPAGFLDAIRKKGAQGLKKPGETKSTAKTEKDSKSAMLAAIQGGAAGKLRKASETKKKTGGSQDGLMAAIEGGAVGRLKSSGTRKARKEITPEERKAKFEKQIENAKEQIPNLEKEYAKELQQVKEKGATEERNEKVRISKMRLEGAQRRIKTFEAGLRELKAEEQAAVREKGFALRRKKSSQPEK
ncbi:MAG: hypothetical protein HN411_04285 [Waddliaceae bacterium]|nr:hypothetical protein [Waddliaceae bacterium]MBT3579546.1 hypothetical protein [Waddliaceae bacterium]